MSKQNQKITLMTMIVFIIMNFVLAMSSTLYNSILDTLAVDFNIPLAQTGYLTSFYAYGAGIGVPIFLVLFKKANRVVLLKWMLLFNIIVTILSIISFHYIFLLAMRFLMGLAGNCYGVLATATIASASPKERVGKNLALLITGSASALMIGIPLTRTLTALYSWQSIVMALIVLMVVSLIYFIIYLPSFHQDENPRTLQSEFHLMKQKNVMIVLIVSMITFIGYGAFYTYLTPYLLHQFPQVETFIGVLLMAVGFCSFAGNLFGGFICDRLGFYKSLLIGTIVQIIISLIIYLTKDMMTMNILFILLWMINGWFIGLQVNTAITIVTHNQSHLMISLNTSGVQLGQAIGTSIASLLMVQFDLSIIIFLSTFTAIIVALILIINPIKRT